MTCFVPLLLLSTVALAQPHLADVRGAFDIGQYEEALDLSKKRLQQGDLKEDEAVELHRLAGLSAFSLGNRPEAEAQFVELLKLNPDYHLDPFAVAPPAISFFEEQRKKLGPTLDVLKERREERVRAEALARQRAEEEEKRRRLEELARNGTVRTVEKRSFLLNFVPLGAGQFQQRRNKMGWFLAISQGLLAVTSVTSYFAYKNQLTEHAVTIEVAPGQPRTVIERGIPVSRQREAQAWMVGKYVSGIGFYALYALGVADALWHHKSDVVTRIESLPLVSRPEPYFFPTSGGAGAGLSFALP